MQTNHVGTSGQIVGLQSVASDLVRLESLLACQNDETMQALRNFSDSPDLMQLLQLHQKQSNELDLFRVLGVQDSELAHSNFLAWLLDPRQNHGLGAYFLKAFLSCTCREAARLGLPSITPARIHAINWDSSEVRREWEYVDLLILNREAKFVCAIENKIWADEGIGADGKSQLTWYRETLKRHFPAFTKHYVFLSPTGMPSRVLKERKYWTPERYATVRELVSQTLQDRGATISVEAHTFMRQYMATLRSNIVPEFNEVAKLARALYLKHRAAIELIYQYKPNYRDDMRKIVAETVAQQGRWQIKDEDAWWFRFRPTEWDQFQAMNSGTGWSSQSLLLCQLYCTHDNTHFYLAVAPGSNQVVREKIFEAARQNPHLFNSANRAFSDGFLTIHQQEHILDASDFSSWDDENAPRAPSLRKWLKNFAENQFPAMNEVIVNCFREYEAEQTC